VCGEPRKKVLRRMTHLVLVVDQVEQGERKALSPCESVPATSLTLCLAGEYPPPLAVAMCPSCHGPRHLFWNCNFRDTMTEKSSRQIQGCPKEEVPLVEQLVEEVRVALLSWYTYTPSQQSS
jgi:hypothetical protein